MNASRELAKYFADIQKETEICHGYAARARKMCLDPGADVGIRIAKNMAERVEGLISVVAPQLVGSGVTKRIMELEKKYSPLDWRVALVIAYEVAKQKFCKFKDEKEAFEVGIRTGFAYHTGGIVAAPLEGFIELKIKKRKDGKEYFAPCYAGPIRGAGGTAAAFSLLIVDYVRTKTGYSTYDPDDNEVNRIKTEIYDYHERKTNLQYLPSEQEIDFLVRNLPVEVDGDPTEKFEVSNYKDLPRVETNLVRGGICLVIAEALAQKAQKLWKRLEIWGEEMGLDWKFLREFLSLQKGIKAGKEEDHGGKSKLTPNFSFINDLVAGRPVLTDPMKKGGFRLRYGRSRCSGFSAASLNPATMAVLKTYIAVGTQLKIERPGKAATITPCDTIEGPIVKLNDGSVLQFNDAEQAKKHLNQIKEILFLGDILINYGDFSENGHFLVPCGYNEEWWMRDLEKAAVQMFGTIDLDKLSSLVSIDAEQLHNIVLSPTKNRLSANEALHMAKMLNIPLPPYFTYHWTLITQEDLKYLVQSFKQSKVIRDGENIVKIIFKFNNGVKEIMESIGLPHRVVNNEFIVVAKHHAAILNACLNTSKEIDPATQVLEILSNTAGVRVMDRSGTFIGARMGRPEKAKMRKMTGSPHVLFPVGEEGGRLRCFQSAFEEGKVTADFPIYNCQTCGRDTIYSVCEGCNSHAKQMFYCRECGVVEKTRCRHDNALPYKRQSIDINYFFGNALKKLGMVAFPDLIKGVRGTSNNDHVPEHLVKGILRAKHEIYVNKDGTVRFDMSELPMTHFKPLEVGTSIDAIKKLGYIKDIHGKDITHENQVIELMPQDIIIPGGNHAQEEPASDVLYRVANFIDELMVKFYGMEAYYNLKNKNDLVGHLVIGLAPHISAGIVGRIIGFSNTQALLAHPLYHAAMRRDCDGDEASISLLLDGFLNFSRQFLPNTRGATMDAPLVLTTLLNPGEVDDQAHGIDTVWQYPLELYHSALEMKYPWELKIEQMKHKLGTDAQYENIGFTHDVENINSGVLCSAYKSLPSMEEKLMGQMWLAKTIRAVDEANVAAMIIEKHFLKDTKGNLRKFSQQQFRCVGCNDKFRRPPLSGRCTNCGGKLIFTISEGSVTKYLGLSMRLAEEYNVPQHLKQSLQLLSKRIEGVFGKEKEKQSGLNSWF